MNEAEFIQTIALHIRNSINNSLFCMTPLNSPEVAYSTIIRTEGYEPTDGRIIQLKMIPRLTPDYSFSPTKTYRKVPVELVTQLRVADIPGPENDGRMGDWHRRAEWREMTQFTESQLASLSYEFAAKLTPDVRIHYDQDAQRNETVLSFVWILAPDLACTLSLTSERGPNMRSMSRYPALNPGAEEIGVRLRLLLQTAVEASRHLYESEEVACGIWTRRIEEECSATVFGTEVRDYVRLTPTTGNDLRLIRLRPAISNEEIPLLKSSEPAKRNAPVRSIKRRL